MENIFDFNEYLKNISEALDNPLPIEWIKTESHWVGSFSFDSNEYKIMIERLENHKDSYVFKFNSNVNKKTELKDALRVLPTVKNAAVEFIKEIKPEIFVFFSTDGARGRKHVYARFCEYIQKEFDYKIKTEGDKIFMLHKEKDDHHLKEVLDEILKEYNIS